MALEDGGSMVALGGGFGWRLKQLQRGHWAVAVGGEHVRMVSVSGSSKQRATNKMLASAPARMARDIRSTKQDDIYGTSNIVLPCPGS